MIFWHALIAPSSVSSEVPAKSEGLSFKEGVTPQTPLSSPTEFHRVSPQLLKSGPNQAKLFLFVPTCAYH